MMPPVERPARRSSRSLDLADDPCSGPIPAQLERASRGRSWSASHDRLDSAAWHLHWPGSRCRSLLRSGNARESALLESPALARSRSSAGRAPGPTFSFAYRSFPNCSFASPSVYPWQKQSEPPRRISPRSLSLPPPAPLPPRAPVRFCRSRRKRDLCSCAASQCWAWR
jgi:hypothetical protein